VSRTQSEFRVSPTQASSRSGRAERGSASIWVVAFIGLVLLAGAVASLRTLAATSRHHAEAAADLAALGAANRIGVDAGACAAATRIAAMNGTELVTCRLDLAPDGRSGTVRVSVRTEVNLLVIGPQAVTAVAQAARDPAIGVGDAVVSRP
jgi:secretion/DNA translocation related TadE-like protein